MIRRHIEEQRHRLSPQEIRSILGTRYTFVGRNLYMTGSLLRGVALMSKAVLAGDHVPENFWYLAAASPPAKAIKRLVGHPSGRPKASDQRAAPNHGDGRLLVPDKADAVPLPPGPPILLVMVDAEAEFDWDGPFSRSLVSVRNLSRQSLTQDIFDRYKVRPTYLVDYAVATQQEGYQPIRDLLRSGRCEIGTHLQPWENPPFAEELSARTSFNHNLPAWLQKEKLETLTEAIISSFGVQPIAYRAGRYGVGDEIGWILSSLGYRIDLSVLPGHDMRWRDGPDFRHAFNQPYWFGPDRQLLEIPLTSGYSGLIAAGGTPQHVNASVYTTIIQPAATRLHLPGVFARLGLLERITLTPEGVSIEELKRLTRLLLQRGQRVFSFNYHSSALLPGYTPYVRSTADLDRMIRTIEGYMHYFMAELGGVSMTPTEFLDMVQPPAPARQTQHAGAASLVQ